MIKHSIKGYTLVEMLVATTVFATVSACFIGGMVTLMQTYNGSNAYAIKSAAELRISDYLALDLRRAQSVAITGTGNQTQIVLSLPNYYATVNGSLVHCLPIITSTATYYSATISGSAIQVTYSIVNKNMTRVQTGGPSIGGALVAAGTTTLAYNVQDFQLTVLDSGTETATQAASNGFDIPSATQTTGRIAEIKTQVSFGSTYTNNPVTDTGSAFYNTTLMRNSLSNALYSGTTTYSQ